MTGSRPTNLWKPSNNVQEVQAGPEVTFLSFTGEFPFIACMYSPFCVFFGLEDVETAQQLQEALESPSVYGAGNVEVEEASEGSRRFLITSVGEDAGRPVPELKALGEGASTKVVSVGGSGRLVVDVTNVGDAPLDASAVPLTIEDELPQGMIATDVTGSAGIGSFGPVDCVLDNATHVFCAFNGRLPSYEAIEVEVFVSLVGDPPVQGEPGEIKVFGGNAPSITADQEVQVSPEPTSFGIQSFSSSVEEEGGAPTTQAGRHPFQLVTAIRANEGPASGKGEDIKIKQPALVRNLRFPLPAGLVGNVAQAPRCAVADFLSRHPKVEAATLCSDASAVGAISISALVSPVKYLRAAYPVFNLVPAEGEPARFGFTVGTNPVIINTEVDPDNEYRILATARDTTEAVDFLASTFVLWGAPGDPRHDDARGWPCVYNIEKTGPCERPPSLSEDALLRMPVSCEGPLTFGAEAEPWNVPLGSEVDTATSVVPGMNGCNQVPFDPGITATPTSKLAGSSSGLDFQLDMPNAGLLNKDAIAEGQAETVEVTLPRGMTINPSQGEGLVGCSPEDLDRETFDSRPGEGCPEASKVGELQISTPLLKEEARGSLYVATPFDNPYESLINLYMVAKIPERGILIKQTGIVEPDPVTGQLTTAFEELPQIPFTSVKLRLRSGARGSLVTPPACGKFDVVADFLPWSAADLEEPGPDEIVTRTSSFEIERGVDGGDCPSGGKPPFHPGLNAGTINNAAKSYSPFNVRLTRKDGEQEFTNFSIKLPPGVIGKLAGVDVCPDAAIAAAKARTGPNGAQEELDSPSCPANSQVGRTLVGSGVGTSLTYVPGKVYMAGPYNGAKLSVVAITAAKVGPFDLGTVVIRQALKVNPDTAEVFVDATASDPLPHIIQGIEVHLRDIRVYVDRPEFTFNPTNCDRTSTASTVLGSGLDFASAADNEPVTVTSPFQAADCSSLGFKPSLTLQLLGGTKRGDTPRLKAVAKARKNDANIGKVQVTLPHSAFLEQAHIRTVCTRVQFNAGGGNGEKCPKGSVYGKAKAITPLLDEPLKGKVFLRSSNHELPDLVAALHSSKADINLVGRIDSLDGRIRNTFESVPDAPVTEFILEMQGGQKGLIVNSTNICKGKHRAIANFTGQNGKFNDFKPVVKAKCAGKKSKSSRSH
jgi:hypothetical protein